MTELERAKAKVAALEAVAEDADARINETLIRLENERHNIKLLAENSQKAAAAVYKRMAARYDKAIGALKGTYGARKRGGESNEN